MLDVGAGDTEGEQMGEELEGKEEREAESGLRLVGGSHLPHQPLPLQGPWTETIKSQAQTYALLLSCLMSLLGALDPATPPLPSDGLCHPLAHLDCPVGLPAPQSMAVKGGGIRGFC